jgi:hypothetical protein
MFCIFNFEDNSKIIIFSSARAYVFKTLILLHVLLTIMQVRSAPRHELLAGDVRARAGARGRLHATPQPHRSSAWTWRRTFSPPPPARGPTGLGAHLPPRAGPSVILGVWPPRGYGPAAHARPSPQRTQTASNSKKEGLQKGHAQVCTRPPAARKHTRLPRALAHNNARLCEALLYAVRWVSGGSARSHLRRRGASLRLASHHVRGHPATRQPAPARACPVPSAGIPLARASGHPLVSWGPLAPPGF